MWESVDQAYRLCVSSAGINLSDAKHVSDKDITSADHFLMSVVKQTEGMPDSERIKYLHHSITCILPYLQEYRRPEYASQQERIKKISSVLAAAYIDHEEACDSKPNKNYLKKLKNFAIDTFNVCEWSELADVIGYEVGPEDYTSDIYALYQIGMNIKQFDAIKNAAERGK